MPGLGTLTAVAAAVAAVMGPAASYAAVDPGDATVVAVIDSAINPYHVDFDPVAGLPSTQAPHTWLPGFPDPGAFASYEKLHLARTTDESAPVAELHDTDLEKWSAVPRSTRDAAHVRWLPGSKIIGLLDFAGNRGYGSLGAHGTRAASVAVGSRYGTCPECLLVFISYATAADGEAAISWALDQPWIDVITNSYGFSAVSRDRLYSGSDTDAQKRASERGQTVFFSAGNGQNNDYMVPNTTLFSSQEGPDWIVTVGGVDADGFNWTGTGKPADVAGPSQAYPSQGGSTVGGTGTFSGTSNATPVNAGLFASALGRARSLLPGPSRRQDAGVVATGDAGVPCGAAHPDCELADGRLTARELRTRYLHAAVRTPQGLRVGAVPAPVPDKVPIAPEEGELLAEGHGTFWGRARSTGAWHAELDRIAGPLDGSVAPVARPPGEREWFVVDSWCRQQLWGTWGDGYWRAGEPLPAPDPVWPTRSALTLSCDGLFPPLR